MNVIFDQQVNGPVFPFLQLRYGSRGLLIYGIYELDDLLSEDKKSSDKNQDLFNR